MITGAHAIIHSPAADEIRTFLRDVLEFPSVDAGGGWLIFALPPAEKGVRTGPVHEERWGTVTTLTLPGGSDLGLYQPKHPTAHG